MVGCTRTIAILGAAAALAAPLAAVSTGAGGERFKTEITMILDTGGANEIFRGVVESEDAACERRRKVKVVYDAPPGYADDTYGTHANRRGRWTFDPPYPKPNPGTWTAVAPKDPINRGVCRRDKSEPFRVIVP